MTATRIEDVQRQLDIGLARIDPHHRLRGRPVTFRLIDGQSLEITFRDVAGIAESEVLGVKKVLGKDCYCTVSPQTAECVIVRFILPLPG